MPFLLQDLLPDQDFLSQLTKQQTNLKISAIITDSRQVTKGAIFFALKGGSFNAIDFIDDALSQGAVAIICHSEQKIKNLDDNIAVIKCDDPHALLVFMLGKFYSNLPSNIFAVSGTNGKTSIAEFTRQMLQMSGKKAASIGTLGVVCDEMQIYKEINISSLTTPDIVSLYQNLAILKKHNIDNVIIEASSIGIEQGRMDGIKFAVKAFSNFSQDHLDYHGNLENYFNAKMQLFSKLDNKDKALAVINADSQKYQAIKQICQNNNYDIFAYGKNANNAQDIKLLEVKQLQDFQAITFTIGNNKYQSRLTISGDFQAMNILCSLAIINCYYPDISNNLADLIDKLPNLKTAQGRMQKIATLTKETAHNAQIYIDFAHTPDALTNALTNAKKFTKGRLLVLLGCGGNRDKAKRPIMGKIATDLADITIITDDNPRNENPTQIRAEIIKGCNISKIIEINSRKSAIKQAVNMLQKNDILIIAGKGHEQYQIIGDKKINFNEEEIVRDAVCKLRN